ncbi:MAG: flavodoxin-dependent (E)-4-hydroxy-3-methylbut-2-enyl-diphosphate synthase [Nitrospirae bacterium]|nr:flavodoxin-dependent (E)-4-hydroxy-3-methylbut-2-enyl-diphosphate synthase [Nitrospirota bacterium]MBF0540243.1 flavodoxin-dependent (E)-4-hydroxy-3-methylbut-2-enyl-diphosphate synthase [Nitrospirota bacterium]
MNNKLTRQIKIGGLLIGGGAPISVQSMTKTDTADVVKTVAQINQLKDAGCDAVRVAVRDEEAAIAVKDIVRQSSLPLIADIHFDYKLALMVISYGINGLRINPGNIGDEWKVRELVHACKNKGIPIRIGVNAGSLEKELLVKYGHPTAQAIVESAQRHIEILEGMGFQDIKVSLKASNVPLTIEAYSMFAAKYDYPLHIGISEAGPMFSGTIKSAVGLGILLAKGIGDTMRVSLTADPVEEVGVAFEILKSLGLRKRGVDIVSCPTCGRCQYDLLDLIKVAEPRIRAINKEITVALMGCAVNGPGEAREADYGIAGGKGSGMIFKKGKIVKKVLEGDMIDTLIKIIEEDNAL